MIPFSWTVHNDGNRVEDAREIRQEFLNKNRQEYRPVAWYEMDASMLEVLMAISKRMAFKTDVSPGVWFWKLIENLGLEYCTDSAWSQRTRLDVLQTTEQLINRTYQPDGKGGLFPLNDPPEDQREVEIWLQMNAYLWERMPYL